MSWSDRSTFLLIASGY